MTQTIAPHGGKLINRGLTGSAAEEAKKKAAGLKQFALQPYEISDLEMIASGALSPLTGFMGQADFNSVLDSLKLADGNVWSLPVVKSVTTEQKASLKVGEEITLVDGSNQMPLAIMKIKEIYAHDKKKHASKAYGTEEEAHPGVARVLSMGDFLVAGDIDLFQKPEYKDFNEYRIEPAEMRKIFADKKWRRIVAFQTRNPIHRAHEYLTKCALEMTDGLLIHPLVGATKGDDISAEVRMKCYRVLLDNYYAKDRTILGVFPAAMRYAGPREAIFHAIARKNYGCTHFIVGRDHAGVSRPDGKPYYGSFDAHFIFDQIDLKNLEITPVFFDFTFFCKTCGGTASTKSCPHDPSHHVALSGTKVRDMLKRGELPPAEFSRPEVAQILIDAMREQATV